VTPEVWREVEGLYLEASALAPSDRAAFLDRSCAGQPALRSEVDSLLGADLERSDFLDLPPSRLVADLMKNQRQGPESIGRYRILGILGEGGMGTVYQAEQPAPHRVVALKMIRAGMLSGEVLRRFERESEALGRLQHPGIAQIYDAGTAGEQPYFAMEFVEGRPLMSYASDHSLDTRARLELMAKICDAVHHAHQRGILRGPTSRRNSPQPRKPSLRPPKRAGVCWVPRIGTLSKAGSRWRRRKCCNGNSRRR
jgi:hypothetical protein